MFDLIIEKYESKEIDGSLLRKTAALIIKEEINNLMADNDMEKDAAAPHMKVKEADRISRRILEFARKNPALQTFAALTTMAAIKAIVKSIISARNEQEMDRVIGQILHDNPSLDRQKAEKIFNMVRKMAPDVAMDLAAAEGYIVPHVEWDHIPMSSLKDLTQIEKNLIDSRKEAPSALSKAIENLGTTFANALALGGLVGKRR